MNTRELIGFSLIVGSVPIPAAYPYIWAPMLFIGGILLIWPRKD